ncbi:MAG: hypothetical protein MRERV_14c042 [Mycoplasmataceae bacterium RV_VA103A]|nr:MAG: hypothetical protein MRERV_14c042 [Mycoplasmataceae bacterium RV_VA103A]
MRNNKNHCHKCEKAKHLDFYFAVWSVAMTIFVILLSGWEALKYMIWPWLFLVVIYIGKYFIDKEEKKKKEEEQKKQMEWEIRSSKRTSIATGKKKLEQAEKDLENGKKEVKLEDDDEKSKQIEL